MDSNQNRESEREEIHLWRREDVNREKNEINNEQVVRNQKGVRVDERIQE